MLHIPGLVLGDCEEQKIGFVEAYSAETPYFNDRPDAKAYLDTLADNMMIEECQSQFKEGRLKLGSVDYVEYEEGHNGEEDWDYKLFARNISAICLSTPQSASNSCNTVGQQVIELIHPTSPPELLSSQPVKPEPKIVPPALELEVESYFMCYKAPENATLSSMRTFACAAAFRKDESTLCATSDGSVCTNTTMDELCIVLGQSKNIEFTGFSPAGFMDSKSECMKNCDPLDSSTQECLGYISDK